MKKVDELKEQSMRLVGNSIRARRIQKNLSIMDLAMRSNITDNALSKIERGIQEPGFFTLQKIAAGLGLRSSLELLLDSDHTMYPDLKDLAKNQWE